MNPKWYLVKTKPLNETRVYTRLTGASYEVLFPKFRKRSRRKGEFEIRPLFPTYLFVRFPPDDLRKIKYTHGVARVVSFGVEPQEVGEEIISAIRERMDENNVVTLVTKPVAFAPGEKVKICEGPFAGIDAIFVEEMPDRERVVLLLDAMSSFRVTIDKAALGE